MRKLLSVCAAALLSLSLVSGVAEAKKRVAAPRSAVNVYVDVSSQTMSVNVNGWHYATWRVSTARDGYYTPRGSYRPRALALMHYSRKYDNSPMPHSVFFKGGYAIHATYATRALGRPASHGCIRLHPSNAATLYGLVRQYGMGATRINIVN
jgi:lipoprotein-anchoring transpeptidase ErfK/SrfK